MRGTREVIAATRRRIAVTGFGMVTAVGRNAEESWQALRAGRSGCAPISRFHAASFPVRIAAEIPRPYWGELRHGSLAYTFAERAIDEALAMAGLAGQESNSKELGPETALVVGVGGDDDAGEDRLLGLLDQLGVAAPSHPYARLGEVAQPPLAHPGLTLEALAPALALRYGIEGEVLSVSTACASGAHAIAIALDLLWEGAAERVVAVGTDAMISRVSLANFCALGVLSRRNGHPEAACRPFDARRQGFVLGEGAGALVLENDRPGALGYVIGRGLSADADSITNKESDGTGVLLSILQALHHAAAAPAEICFVKAHGTGTRANDAGEAAALRRALGEHATRIPISSIKGQIGHTIAAAGAIEAIVTLLALAARQAPGISGLELVSPDLADLNLLRPGLHPLAAGLGLSLAAGFGGVNVSLVLAGPEG